MDRDFEIYRGLMGDIKFRLDKVYTEYALPAVKTGVDVTRFEFACLQLRMSLESLAFASLAGASDLWPQEQTSYAKENNFGALLRRLEGLNSRFLPTSTKIVGRDSFGVVQLRDGSVQLTRHDLSAMYGKLGKVLHVRNPFSTALNIKKAQDDLRRAHRKLRDFLQCHVAIFANGRHVLVQMGRLGEDVQLSVLRAL